MNLGHAAKVITTGTPTLITGGKPGARAGNEGLAFNNPGLQAVEALHLESSAFSPQQPIPSQYSGDGRNVSPPLKWSGAPAESKSLALVVEDPDAPLPKPFVHWLIYNLPPETTTLAEAVPHDNRQATPPMMQGQNSSLKVGYTGAAPPKGDTPHHYHFQLFALDRRLALEPGAGRSALFQAMSGHVLARGELIGTYQR